MPSFSRTEDPAPPPRPRSCARRRCSRGSRRWWTTPCALPRTGGARPARILLAFANARAGRLDTARSLIDAIEVHADAPVHEAVMLAFIREAGADSPVLARQSEFRPVERELFPKAW